MISAEEVRSSQLSEADILLGVETTIQEKINKAIKNFENSITIMEEDIKSKCSLEKITSALCLKGFVIDIIDGGFEICW